MPTGSGTTYYLEMRDRADLKARSSHRGDVALFRVQSAMPELDRFFYADVMDRRREK